MFETMDLDLKNQMTNFRKFRVAIGTYFYLIFVSKTQHIDVT